MNARSALADLLRSCTRIELLPRKQPLRLVPRTAADELPPYPEQTSMIDGVRPREATPTALAAQSVSWPPYAPR